MSQTPDQLTAIEAGLRIRVKPWALPPPPDGREWHRSAEFTEADLPEGYRPMLVGETAIDGDEFLPYREDAPVGWLTRVTGGNVNCNIWLDSEAISKHRTKRPLLVDPYAALKAQTNQPATWAEYHDTRTYHSHGRTRIRATKKPRSVKATARTDRREMRRVAGGRPLPIRRGSLRDNIHESVNHSLGWL